LLVVFSGSFRFPRAIALWFLVDFSWLFQSQGQPLRSTEDKRDTASRPVLAAAVGPMRSASPPDFSGILLAPFLGRFVDNCAAGIVRTSGVLQSCLGILSECPGARIELTRAFPLPGPRHRDS
jgi:hypothetical protein